MPWGPTTKNRSYTSQRELIIVWALIHMNIKGEPSIYKSIINKFIFIHIFQHKLWSLYETRHINAVQYLMRTNLFRDPCKTTPIVLSVPKIAPLYKYLFQDKVSYCWIILMYWLPDYLKYNKGLLYKLQSSLLFHMRNAPSYLHQAINKFFKIQYLFLPAI